MFESGVFSSFQSHKSVNLNNQYKTFVIRIPKQAFLKKTTQAGGGWTSDLFAFIMFSLWRSASVYLPPLNEAFVLCDKMVGFALSSPALSPGNWKVLTLVSTLLIYANHGKNAVYAIDGKNRSRTNFRKANLL